ncbi:MAG: alpha/beta hydrolase [Pseudomonadota bacterium]|nr:alpha/beta hydrolase [Pseudomonadota bacterium]
MARSNSSPHLEVISCLPEGPARQTPLLFVHGAFAGAWCWAEHFLPYFAGRGYAAHALSLRGHGGSDGHERLLWTGLREYASDLERVIGDLGRPPVLVGHSMGGMVVQKYLERASAPAVVLMAAVPPQGLLGASLWLAARDPLLFHELQLIQFGGPHFATVSAAQRAIFSADMPYETVARYFSRMQPESQRVMLDMTWYDLPRFKPDGQVPMLVLGAENDALLAPAMVRSTARAYGAEADILPNMAHAMMLEAGWRRAAKRLADWLDKLDL